MCHTMRAVCGLAKHKTCRVQERVKACIGLAHAEYSAGNTQVAAQAAQNAVMYAEVWCHHAKVTVSL